MRSCFFSLLLPLVCSSRWDERPSLVCWVRFRFHAIKRRSTIHEFSLKTDDPNWRRAKSLFVYSIDSWSIRLNAKYAKSIYSLGGLSSDRITINHGRCCAKWLICQLLHHLLSLYTIRSLMIKFVELDSNIMRKRITLILFPRSHLKYKINLKQTREF